MAVTRPEARTVPPRRSFPVLQGVLPIDPEAAPARHRVRHYAGGAGYP